MMDFGGHLRGLFRFSGRERRTTFWLWVLVSYIVQMIVSTVAVVPMMMSMFAGIQRYIAAHPDFGQPGVPPPPPNFMFSLFPFVDMILIGLLVLVVLVVTLAAAVTRRLHDTGRTGWWALLPVPFMAASLGLMGALFDSFRSFTPGQPPQLPPAYAWLMLNNAGYLISLGTLIVFCCFATDEQPNRYGPPPGRGVG